MNMFRTPLTRRVLATTSRQTPRLSPSFTRTTNVAATRTFSQYLQKQAAKDTQDKDSLKPESNEYSKSGSDAQAAQDDAAFDPSKTRPEEQENSSEAENGGKDNPLNVSPANKDVSKPRSPTEGGHEGSSAESSGQPSDRARTSGGGSPDKGAKGQKYSS